MTEALKDAFQKEGFEGIAFEPTEIVEDACPSKTKRNSRLTKFRNSIGSNFSPTSRIIKISLNCMMSNLVLSVE